VKLSRNLRRALQELIDLLGNDDIREIEVEKRLVGGRIRIVRGAAQAEPIPLYPGPKPGPETEAEPPAEESPAGEEDGHHTVLSPMVGLLYLASSPDSPPFVEEGDIVSPGQTLCIIEAMKIMNEIEADIKGRVVRVLVENGRPVEYNTPLFLLEPF
jgi:acetyl-CoA carboxylase biotin carboxyl carrier protein